MKSHKLILLSFADKRYAQSLLRLKCNTENFGFDNRYFWNEDNLDSDILDIIRPKLYRRGYGYWGWKPYIVKTVFDQINDGDIIFYTDAGTLWNDKGINRFQEYVEMLGQEENDILCFTQPFLEKDWTKADVFEKLNAYNEDIFLSYQLWSGTFGLKKTEKTKELIKRWLNICKTDFNLFTDKKSVLPNLYGFREHRHDQSIFSILVKQYPHIEISWKENTPITPQCKDSWQQLTAYPILSNRLKSKDKKPWKKLMEKFKLPYKYFIGRYLTYFHDFYFAGKRTY